MLKSALLLLLISVSDSAKLNFELDADLDVEQQPLLAPAVRELAQVHVLLRRQQLQADASNNYARWFLHHSDVPHSIHSYEATTLTMTTPPSVGGSRDSYVLVTSLAQLSGGLLHFVQRAGVYFFILGEPLEEQRAQLRQICAQLWTQRRLYKSYLLALDGIWYYDPFEDRLLRYKGDEPLERLIFHDMRGYPLRVQIFRSVYSRPKLDPVTGKLVHVTGVDVEVAKLLVEALNFSMQLQQPDPNYFGERSTNGSYNGAIGSLMVDGLDMCLTGFFVKDYLVQDYMDFTVAVYDDQLCIYVPKAKRIPQSILPIFAVGYDIWLGFILSAFACACVWLLLRLLNLRLGLVRARTRLWRQALRIVVDTWVVWVRVNIARLPSSYAERIFIGSLCLVSVIFGAIFESSLATVYIHPLRYKDINTMQELDDSGLKVVYKYTSMADDLFFSETSALFASLNKKLVWNRFLNTDVMKEVATSRSKSGVSRYSSVMLEQLEYVLSGLIWVVPECPKYYTMAYVMPKDAPWEEAVNAVLLRLLSAGLISKQIDDMETQVDIQMRGKQVDAEGDSFRVLTVDDVQLAFYVVLGGNLFSALAYLAERVWARTHRKISSE